MAEEGRTCDFEFLCGDDDAFPPGVNSKGRQSGQITLHRIYNRVFNHVSISLAIDRRVLYL